MSRAVSVAAQKNGGDSDHPIWRACGMTISISSNEVVCVFLVVGHSRNSKHPVCLHLSARIRLLCRILRKEMAAFCYSFLPWWKLFFLLPIPIVPLVFVGIEFEFHGLQNLSISHSF